MIPFSSLLITTAYTRGKSQTVTTPCKTDSLKTFAVSGRVTQTYSYCGGASPPKQVLDRLANPVAYSGKKFYIRQGKANSTKAKVVKSFTTGKDGEFSIRLTPGVYAVILEEQLNKIRPADLAKENQQVDEQCLFQWWVKPYYLLVVKDKNIPHLNFTFHHRCFISSDIPCVNYIGPLVP